MSISYHDNLYTTDTVYIISDAIQFKAGRIRGFIPFPWVLVKKLSQMRDCNSNLFNSMPQSRTLPITPQYSSLEGYIFSFVLFLSNGITTFVGYFILKLFLLNSTGTIHSLANKFLITGLIPFPSILVQK